MMLSDSVGLAVSDALCGINEWAKETEKKEIWKKRGTVIVFLGFFREKYTKFKERKKDGEK